jgi:hypothetical protein
LLSTATEIRRTTDAIADIARLFSEAGLVQIAQETAERMRRINEEQLRIQTNLEQLKDSIHLPDLSENPRA